MFIISKKAISKGFRNFTDDEIAEQFLKIDKDKNYFITKNEWMMYFIMLFENQIDALDEEGFDSIMGKIQQISDEFDKIDDDGNKQIDYLEFEDFVRNNVYLSID